jgi:hypothetical protein
LSFQIVEQDDLMSERRKSMSESRKPRDLELTDPSPEEIQRRADKIRKGWTQDVKARRQAWADLTWRPPLVMTIELVRLINEKQE